MSANDPLACRNARHARASPLGGKFPALAAVATRVEQHVASRDLSADRDLTDLCYAAAMRKTHLDHRAAIHFGTAEELRQHWPQYRLAKAMRRSRWAAGRGAAPRLVFVFSGHGGQWRGMHRPLWNEFPAFRDKIEECDSVLKRYVTWSLLEELNADEPSSQQSKGTMWRWSSPVSSPSRSRRRSLEVLGIEPDAIIGHGIGEIAAAHVAGVWILPTPPASSWNAAVSCRRPCRNFQLGSDGGDSGFRRPGPRVDPRI